MFDFKNFKDSIVSEVENKVKDLLDKDSNSNPNIEAGAVKPNKHEDNHSGGKHRALFIGINYFNTSSELRGCLNDVKNINKFVRENYPKFKDIRVMTDDQNKQSEFYPTRANIESAFRWLVKDAAPGDSFFLHYSGHGGNVKDTSGDEKDGQDETICPVDYQSAGQITDDDLHDMLIKNLPERALFTALFDSCHSGSVLDLPYTYSVDSNNNLVKKDNRLEAAKHAFHAARNWKGGDKKAAFESGKRAIFALMNKDDEGDANKHGDGSQTNSDAVKQRTTKATVCMLSGSHDTQTSADASIGGHYTGAMSWALLSVMSEHENKDISYLNVLTKTRGKLHGKYTQIPQLSTGFEMDMNQAFTL